jgi:hypothetical protein
VDEPALVLEFVLVVVLLLLHAAIVSAAATAMPAMAGFLEPRIRLSSPDDAEELLGPGLLLGGPPGAAESGGRASRMTSATVLRNFR